MINNFSILNIYEKPKANSKLSSQMLYGEKFNILSKNKNWIKIKTSYDNYISACDDDLISKYTFYPWICRGLFELGAHPIGIDYGSLTGEKFEHYDRVNLLLENSLSMIDDNSIDIVHTKLLYNSPQLEMMKGDTEKLKYILVPQIKRVLKTDGILLADWDKTI